MQQEWTRGAYTISTDKQRLDLDTIHGFLVTAYWSVGVPRDVVQRAIEGALTFGVYKDDQQIGFARVITDYATFAYISDVFILPQFRGQGLAIWLIETI